MAIDPVTAALLAKGAGQLVETGFGLYDKHEGRKLDRRAMALQEQSQGWKRLMDMVQAGQELPQRAMGVQRMIALRNSGRGV